MGSHSLVVPEGQVQEVLQEPPPVLGDGQEVIPPVG